MTASQAQGTELLVSLLPGAADSASPQALSLLAHLPRQHPALSHFFRSATHYPWTTRQASSCASSIRSLLPLSLLLSPSLSLQCSGGPCLMSAWWYTRRPGIQSFQELRGALRFLYGSCRGIGYLRFQPLFAPPCHCSVPLHCERCPLLLLSSIEQCFVRTLKMGFILHHLYIQDI